MYDVARYTIEHYPNLEDALVHWFSNAINSPSAGTNMARELLRREKTGHPIDRNDVSCGGCQRMYGLT